KNSTSVRGAAARISSAVRGDDRASAARFRSRIAGSGRMGVGGIGETTAPADRAKRTGCERGYRAAASGGFENGGDMGGMDLIAQIAASGTVAFFGGPPPAPLPDGPFWERWLLEEPLWTAVALAVGGVVVFMILNRAGQARQGLIAAGAGLVLAAG